VRSWSATVRYIQFKGSDPVPDLQRTLSRRWGDATVRQAIRWPLRVRAAVMRQQAGN